MYIRQPQVTIGATESDIHLLTVAEVATILSISRAMTYRLIRSGEIASVSLGRSVRVPSYEIPALIKRKMRLNQSGAR